MYLLLVCLPLLSFLLCCGFGRFFGYRGSPILATVCVALSALLSILAFYEVGICGSPCYLDFAPWFHSELFDASWGFLFDSLTVVMLVVVTVVSTLVHCIQLHIWVKIHIYHVLCLTCLFSPFLC